ncbi:hypothetical protein BDV98DRAFT_571465 [Pterulicium gracile]|uniref:Uncharacterized protein n=1 Tax=Pterulicium gracile TaxID=1884261 RepID=A0A5C3QDW4_9AGAR|nr:hypothetical protein BDV98DRAFT_571465 [Pterula gracilis]
MLPVACVVNSNPQLVASVDLQGTGGVTYVHACTTAYSVNYHAPVELIYYGYYRLESSSLLLLVHENHIHSPARRCPPTSRVDTCFCCQTRVYGRRSFQAPETVTVTHNGRSSQTGISRRR